MAEEINTDTSMAPEPVQAAGGENPVSFDELDQAQAIADKGDPGEMSSRKKMSEKVSGENAAAKTDKDKAAEAAEKKADVKEKEAEVDLQKENSAEKEKTSASSGKTVSIKAGDDAVELPVDAKIKIPVDGEEQEVSLQEALDGISGQRTIRQRFSQLRDERAEFEADRATIDDFARTVIDTAQQDVLESVALIAEKTGVDPVQFKVDFLDAIAESAQRWSEMSPIERENYRLEQQNAYAQRRLNHTNEVEAERNQIAEVDRQVSQIEQRLGINRQQFHQAYSDLVNAPELEGREITPELVEAYVHDMRMNEEAAEVLGEVSKDLVGNADAQDVMVQIMQEYPQLERSDIVEIAKETFGTRSKEAVTKKVARANPAAVSRETVRPQNDPISFEDLDAQMG